MKDKDNRGITLIELLVIIAIMGVVAGAFGLAASAISKQKVKDAALETKQMIQLAQIYSKSRENCKLVFQGFNDGDGIETKIMLYDTNSDGSINRLMKELVINHKIKVSLGANTSLGSTYLPLGLTTVDIPINRSTGGFGKSEFFHGFTNDATVTRISFEQGDKIITLNLATYTGLVTVDYNH